MIGGAGVDVNVVELESYLATAFTPESTFAMSDDTHTLAHTWYHALCWRLHFAINVAL